MNTEAGLSCYSASHPHQSSHEQCEKHVLTSRELYELELMCRDTNLPHNVNSFLHIANEIEGIFWRKSVDEGLTSRLQLQLLNEASECITTDCQVQ